MHVTWNFCLFYFTLILQEAKMWSWKKLLHIKAGWGSLLRYWLVQQQHTHLHGQVSQKTVQFMLCNPNSLVPESMTAISWSLPKNFMIVASSKDINSPFQRKVYTSVIPTMENSSFSELQILLWDHHQQNRNQTIMTMKHLFMYSYQILHLTLQQNHQSTELTINNHRRKIIYLRSIQVQQKGVNHEK